MTLNLNDIMEGTYVQVIIIKNYFFHGKILYIVIEVKCSKVVELNHSNGMWIIKLRNLKYLFVTHMKRFNRWRKQKHASTTIRNPCFRWWIVGDTQWNNLYFYVNNNVH